MPAGTVFSAFNVLRGFSRGIGRADAYFHAGFAGILVLGVVFVAPAVDAVWEGLNRGVRFPLCSAATAACTLLMERKKNGQQGCPQPHAVAPRTLHAASWWSDVI